MSGDAAWAEYGYNYQSQRVWVKGALAAEKRFFIHDLAGNIIGEYKPDGEPLSEYVYAGMWRLFRMDGTPENQGGGGAGGGGVCGGGNCAISVGNPNRGTLVVNGLIILFPAFLFGVITYRKRPLKFVAISATLIIGFGALVILTEKAQAQNDLAEVDYYYHNDHLMTPMFMTDSSGTVVWQMSQSPFDTQIIDEDPDDDDTTVSNPFRFPGQYADSETDNILWYNWNRYYIPSLGRYGQADPIGHNLEGLIDPIISKMPDTFNIHNGHHYTYSVSNPITIYDPLGLWPKPANGKWCPVISRKDAECDCPQPALGNSITNIVNKVQYFCNTTKLPAQQKSGNVEGSVDYNNGKWRAWIIPTGVGCVDYCRCNHEDTHVNEINAISPGTKIDDAFICGMECRAYKSQLNCINSF